MAEEDVTEGSKFDIDLVTKLFENSLMGNNDISLPLYIDAYEEINKFFPLLSKGFSFVEKDLLEKEKILHELHAVDPVHYETVNSMISWECRSGTPSEKGSRTLLRLHRALLFIIDFLKNLKDSGEEDQISTLCQASYDSTLSKHHSWIVRKLVGVATHLLASRDCLLNALIKERSPQHENEVKQAITKLIGVAEKVSHRLQQIYENKNILNLP
uniref:GLTP domain-containing protein n=1 Tax=Elaeophora elaphi TaxID=1147741 RepID=A0A0R3S028_9BILA